MPVNTKPGVGVHKDLSLIIASATNVGSATFIVLRGVLNRMPMGILKPVYSIVRDAVSALRSARKM